MYIDEGTNKLFKIKKKKKNRIKEYRLLYPVMKYNLNVLMLKMFLNK